MSRTQLFVPFLAGLLLTGCSNWRDLMPVDAWREVDNQAPPAELTDIPNPIAITTRWSHGTGKGAGDQRVKLVPAIGAGRILTADSQGQVTAHDLQSGGQVWSTDTKAAITGGPGIGDGLVLLGSGDAEVIALDLATGNENWRKRVSSEVLSIPRASQGVVVAHSIDGKVHGLNARTGTRVWVYDRTAPVLTLRGSSSPVIEGSRAIIGLSNGKLASIDLGSGNPNWEVTVSPPKGRSELERIVDIDADPLLVQGYAFVVTYQGDMAALSQENGQIMWRREMSSYAGLTADRRQLLVTDTKSRVWGLDPRNGSSLWKQDKLLNRRMTAPAVLGDLVLVGDLEGYVHWLAAEDGSLRGRVKIASSPITAPPLVYDGVAYVLANDGTLAALSPGGS